MKTKIITLPLKRVLIISDDETNFEKDCWCYDIKTNLTLLHSIHNKDCREIIAAYPTIEGITPIHTNDLQYLCDKLNVGRCEIELDAYQQYSVSQRHGADLPRGISLHEGCVVFKKEEKKSDTVYTEDDIMKALYFTGENGYEFYMSDNKRHWYKDDFEAGESLTDKQILNLFKQQKE